VNQEKHTFSGDDAGPAPESGPLDLAYLNLVKLKPGTVVNERYRLEKLIGQGGFGIVFEAFDLTLGSRVAVKFLNPKLTGNQKKFLRVKREINLSRKISDGRIIKVFSLESWREIHFLVMELAAGRSLKSLLEEKGRLGWPEFKAIFLDILEAIAVLHGSGIVHRDLKPANILIDGALRVKILDFGLAKEVDDTERTSTVGEIVGSPYYMSPEQIRGGEIGFSSDVYQLGLLLYRTLSGRHPFEHTSTMEVIFKQLNQRPERLAPVESGLPRFLRVGMEKALEKTPSRRFRDAGAMAHFFKKEKLSWLHQLLFSVTRGPIKWGLAVLALAALLLFAYFATFGSRAVHVLRPQGGILEARNRFGVRVWQRDFSPFTVFHAHLTGSVSPVPLGTGIPEEYLGMRLNGAEVVFVLLAPPPDPVFPPESSIASADLMCQQAILDQRGRILRREPFLRGYEFDAYDYIRVIKPYQVRLLAPGAGIETDALVQVQQYQSMYPFAMVFMRGIKKYIYTNPGTFEVFPQGERDGLSRFMFFGVNNLFSHMSFIAENGFTPATTAGVVIKGIPNLLADYRANIPFVGTLFILPSEARLIENRWRDQGLARFDDGFMGDIVSVDRNGQFTVRGKGGVSSYWDSPDTLRRVYTLVNSAYQERIKKHNLKNSRELIGQALAFPLQNPYLRSALHCLQGDLEIGLGLYADGERSLSLALEFYPGNNDAHERLCEMDVLKGEPESALRRLAETFADGSKFWGFHSFGVSLFKGYVFLHQGMFSNANDEFAKIKLDRPGVVSLCRAAADVFGGNYAAATAALRQLEKLPLETVDLRELRLLLGRTLLLDFTDERRARFLFEDIFRNSLEYGHLAEISTCYFLARAGRTTEAAKAAREAFSRLQARARGEFMTHLWLFYDAYVYGRTMEIANDRAEAARGYRACIEANPHTGLANHSRQRLKLLDRLR
jgi:tRNA A-37 threonylcarbamoyl transferase component Bud32/tetratricopeptide (TPR) repeat protein